MKRNQKQSVDQNLQTPRVVPVKFVHTEAVAVVITRTFNDWRPEATPMLALGEERSLKELYLAQGGYEYRLAVDGKWMSDPLARETEPNLLSEPNSVLKVD